MRPATLNVFIALLSALSIPCAAQNFRYSGTEYIVFSGNITGTVSYPPEFDCAPLTKSYANTHLYVGKNAPWDSNAFFFDLYHRASDTSAFIGLTRDYIYNLEFTTASYDCIKDGKPCGIIAYAPDFVPHMYVDLNKTKISKTQVEGKAGYAVSGDTGSLVGNGTDNGVDIADSCRKANVNWLDFKWNSTTTLTYTLSFSNETASIKMTTKIPNGEMTLSFTGPRNETASSLHNSAIQLDTSNDAVPQFKYVNGSDIHFAKLGSTWVAAATPIPTGASRSSSTRTTGNLAPTGTGAAGTGTAGTGADTSTPKPSATGNAAVGGKTGVTEVVLPGGEPRRGSHRTLLAEKQQKPHLLQTSQQMEALGAAGSIIGIAGFGLQIATTLQTYAEATLEADDRIRDIANDISATASALQRLQAVITRDENLKNGKVFSVEGLKSVNKIASQCDTVFKRTVELLNKAGKPEEELANAERSKELKISTLGYLKWPWLEPKIMRCRQELERLLVKLFLFLQISSLAVQQASVDIRSADLAAEREMRDIIAKLKAREERLTNRLQQAFFKVPIRQNSRPFISIDQTRDRSPLQPPPPLSSRPLPPLIAATSRGVPLNFQSDFAESNPPMRLDSFSEKPIMNLQSPTLGNVPRPDGKPQVKRVAIEETFNETLPDDRDSSMEVLGETHATSTLRKDGPATNELREDEPGQEIAPYLEAYLLKGDNDHILKIPLEQKELQVRKEALLAKSDRAIWDVLISLTLETHAQVTRALEKARSQDKLGRVLRAIEVLEAQQEVIESMSSEVNLEVPRILLFLEVELPGKLYERRLEQDLRKSGLDERLINTVIEENIPFNTDGPTTYTRMARRHLSVETLRAHNLDWQFDENPDYVIIKRWVPEEEQDRLWEHTKAIRAQRRHHVVTTEESGRKYRESEFEFVRKYKHGFYEDSHKHKENPSPLLTFLLGGGKQKHRTNSGLTEGSFDHQRHKSRKPSPLATFLSGKNKAEPSPEDVELDEAIKDQEVDELLGKWTNSGAVENETEKGKSAEQIEAVRVEENVDDDIGDEFLQTTRLDDYFSDEEESPARWIKKRFGLRWKVLLPSRFRRRRDRRRWSTSTSSSRSGSLMDD
ncbi:uncharacterized protein BP5553_07185 [Venustampulla echinocandica]|uniref:DUF8035 domain-containing protein n=1 Tax=Venustampulla echinocandica TaxID=2656787 RepID=A0A370TIR0_9HELO|nr:uncharacterized protein BP5553_07185 [Venustampulla echinocandica]RDL35254.1 hypothetical protein BP5553_07185 [Venustampulla echinocandica]